MIDEIRGALSGICSRANGAVAAIVMGFDGLELDSVWIEANGDDAPDVSALITELSTMLGQLRTSTDASSFGALDELSVSSERLVALVRPLNAEFFVALALEPGGNVGKGRYLLRVHAPRLAAALA